VRIVAIALLGFAPLSSCAEQTSLDAEPAATDLLKHAAAATELPPLAPAARELLERDPNWQRSLVHSSREPEGSTAALAGHAPRADLPPINPEDVEPHPAPMPGDSRQSPPPTDTYSAHGAERSPRQAAPAEGEGPTRAPPIESELPVTFELLVQVDVGGHDVFFRSEATRIRSGEFLTAGHCLYFPDPDGDGDPRDARWATAAWIRPLAPSDSATVQDGTPPRYIKSASFAVHAQWIAARSAAHDVGVVFAPP
jgi:hypothetical protein